MVMGFACFDDFVSFRPFRRFRFGRSVVSLVSFRWFRFVSLFRVLVHAVEMCIKHNHVKISRLGGSQ